MSLIIVSSNPNRRGKSFVTAHGTVVFDAYGVATVNMTIGQLMAAFPDCLPMINEEQTVEAIGAQFQQSASLDNVTAVAEEQLKYLSSEGFSLEKLNKALTSMQLLSILLSTQKSYAADILTFTIPNQVGQSVIDASAATVEIVMPFGTDVEDLDSTITVSANATISPASRVHQDFTDPVVYAVHAQAYFIKEWTVTVTVAAEE